MAAEGCSGGDFDYAVRIESSSIEFGQVVFQVSTSNGSVYVATGGEPGFSVLNGSGGVLAHWLAPEGKMSMNGGWSYSPGVTGSTPLLNFDTIEVDMGATNPEDQGYTLTGVGTGEISGSTAAINLP